MKRRIFSTYGPTPIKNVPTAINRFNGCNDEDEEPDVQTLAPIYEEADEAIVELLSQIRTILFILLVMKIICLIVKK